MANSLKCSMCGANGFHIYKIDGGYEIVCMTSAGKNHKMKIVGIEMDEVSSILR